MPVNRDVLLVLRYKEILKLIKSYWMLLCNYVLCFIKHLYFYNIISGRHTYFVRSFYIYVISTRGMERGSGKQPKLAGLVRELWCHLHILIKKGEERGRQKYTTMWFTILLLLCRNPPQQALQLHQKGTEHAQMYNNAPSKPTNSQTAWPCPSAKFGGYYFLQSPLQAPRKRAYSHHKRDHNQPRRNQHYIRPPINTPHTI